MKKLLLISMLIGAMPLAMMAQDDDLYFVPKKKKAQVEQVKQNAPVVAPQPKAKSSYEVIDGDTTKLDVIDFTEGKGVYPDSLDKEDFALTKQMARFDDYVVSDNEAFWEGFRAGANSWQWHSPWYYNRYGFGWYDPWWYGSWYGYSSLYSPWYYSWYDPWYYGWYDPWYYGWYDPYWSSWGWNYYGYHGYYSSWYYSYRHYNGYTHYYGGGGGGGHYYGHTGNAGTIHENGSTGYRPVHRNTVINNSSRVSSMRERASSMGGGRTYNSGNSVRSSSGHFSGFRGGSSSYSSGSSSSSGRVVNTNSGSRSSNYNSGYSSSSSSRSSSSSSSSSSFGGSRSSGGGGGFSSGSSRSSGGGGGGGSRMGGRR